MGAWKDNKAHGYGVYTTDVSHYQGTRINNIGEFNQFVKHGYGIEKFTNGDSYRGYYEKGKPHGRGEYTWRNVAVYRGEFKQGLREGEGVWKGASGDEYHGHYSSDRKNGYGSFRWANGNCYKGQFNDDAREGSGEMVWSDGSVYQGEWMKGLPNGTGNHHIQLGLFKVRGQRPRIGIFENNILISESRLNEDSI